MYTSIIIRNHVDTFIYITKSIFVSNTSAVLVMVQVLIFSTLLYNTVYLVQVNNFFYSFIRTNSLLFIWENLALEFTIRQYLYKYTSIVIWNHTETCIYITKAIFVSNTNAILVLVMYFLYSLENINWSLQ